MRTLLKTRYFLLLAALFMLMPTISSAQVAVSISIAPPVIPVYAQPPCPTEGYLWTPGYWAYGAAGYYWVPGVWVAPRRLAFYGRPVTGALQAACMCFTGATGVRTSDSTAVLTTDLGTAVSASLEAVGQAALSLTTRRW